LDFPLLFKGQLPEYRLADVVEPGQDSILNHPEANFGNMPNICSCLDECLNNFGMIPFDCDVEGGVSLGRGVIDVCLHVEEELDKLYVSVICGPHECGLFGVLVNGVVDEGGVLLQQLVHVHQIVLLDVVIKQVRL
jgi:hypothetical protein